MAHPHNQHRDHKVQHGRVSHITHGMAEGGYKHSAEGSDMIPLRKKSRHGGAMHRADGGRVKHRADRPARARGGRVGKKKGKGHTTVNVMVAPHPSAPSLGGAAPPTLPPAMAAPPPRPPMMPPPGVAPPGAMPPGMPPPGLARPPMMPPPGTMPLRARGGKVTDGPAYMEGVRATSPGHNPGKNDGKGLGRGKPITYKTGGRVEVPHHVKKGQPISSAKGPMGPSPGVGGGSGLGRLKKIPRAKAFVNKVP